MDILYDDSLVVYDDLVLSYNGLSPIPTSSPDYSIVIYNRDPTTLGISTRILEVSNPKNLGWADYLNDVPESFFTLQQDDPQIAQLLGHLGQAHIRVYRLDTNTGERSVVWAGIFGTETDENENDVIFYSHGYIAALYWLLTTWDQTWTNAGLGSIASDVWARAKTGIANTEIAFINLSTMEQPATTSGGVTPVILPVYTTFLKPLLNVLREISAVGRSDTTNNVVFEVTHKETPEFNFWGNKGQTRDIVWTWGSDQIHSFWHHKLEAHRRNEIEGVGTSPRELTLRSTQNVAPGLRGRRSTPIYLQWVRDQTELDRITKLRLAKANRDHITLGLNFFPGAVMPPGSESSKWELADKVRVRISQGLTVIDSLMLVLGVQVLFENGSERVRALLETPTGS